MLEVLDREALRADEAPLEVAVDDARGLRGGVAPMDRPGADLLGAGGEVALQAEQRVGRAGHHRQRRLGHAERLEHLAAVLGGELGELRLDLGADDDHLAAVGGGVLADGGDTRPRAVHVGLVHVADVEHRLRGDEAEGAHRERLLGGELEAADRAAFVQALEAAPEDLDAKLRLLVAGAGLPAGLVEGALDLLQVGEHQLGADRVDVAERVDRAGDMHDVVVLEAADDLKDRVDLADVREELVAEALPGACAGDEAGDVDEPHRGGDHLLGLDQRLDAGEARIGHRHDAHIGLDGAEGVVLRLDASGGQGVEEGALADIGQADDAAVHG